MGTGESARFQLPDCERPLTMTRLLAALAAVIAVLTLAGAASAAKPAPANGFTDFTVAATPPNPARTICPGSALPYNTPSQHAIAARPPGSGQARAGAQIHP